MATKRKELKRLNDIHENMLDKVVPSFATQPGLLTGPHVPLYSCTVLCALTTKTVTVCLP